MDHAVNEPSLRKPVGVLLILLLIAVWALLVLVAVPHVLTFAWPLQALFFAIAGTVWIAPLKPLLRWMERSRERG